MRQENQIFAYAKKKAQISFAVTAHVWISVPYIILFAQYFKKGR